MKYVVQNVRRRLLHAWCLQISRIITKLVQLFPYKSGNKKAEVLKMVQASLKARPLALPFLSLHI